MLTGHSAEIPFEHVFAELSAAPFCLTDGLNLALHELDPNMRSDTGKFWRYTETRLAPSLPSFSLDELIALRDRLWFGHTQHNMAEVPAPVPLDEVLQNFSTQVLTYMGDSMHPRRPYWRGHGKQSETQIEDPLARRFWRWIEFALPPDLLVAAHPQRPENSVSSVEIVSPMIARLLQDDGYAETHMHLGAALHFPLLWIAMQHSLAQPNIADETLLCSPGAELDEGRLMTHWVLNASTIRYILAVYLKRRQDNNHEIQTGSVIEFIESQLLNVSKNDRAQSIGSQNLTDMALFLDIKRVVSGFLSGNLFSLYDDVQHDAVPDSQNKGFRALQRLFIKITKTVERNNIRKSHIKNSSRLQNMWCSDTISHLFPSKGYGKHSSEMEFVSASIQYLQTKTGREDTLYARLFWQVIRVRCIFYRHVVQRPLTPGLQWFIRAYRRMANSRQSVGTDVLAESALSVCGFEHGLVSLEARMTPGASTEKLQQYVDEYHNAIRQYIKTHGNKNSSEYQTMVDQAIHGLLKSWDYQKGGTNSLEDVLAQADHQMQFEYGLVLHFSRDRGGGALDGVPKANSRDSHSDPGYKQNLGYRYGAFFKEKMLESQAIIRLIKRFPRSLYIIRGLDVCTDELGIPNWVMASLCRKIRLVSQEASGFLYNHFGERAAPLHMTAHAGEEFGHLLGGLRRIDETIRYFEIAQGDRIGHGIALGVDPISWAKRIRGVAMSRSERLFDLGWEWQFRHGDNSSEGHQLSSDHRTGYLINEIGNLSREVYGFDTEPTVFVQFMDLLYDHEALEMVGFPSGSISSEDIFLKKVRKRFRRNIDEASPEDKPWQLLYRYLIDLQTFVRGEVNILIDPSEEAESLLELQKALRKKVGQYGITIEINPSSNLLIGDIGDLRNHPLWRLKAPIDDNDDIPPVAVCIGSDDPLTFATSTRTEYQLVYDTLILAGLSDQQARSWMDDARKVGLNSRFTFPHNMDSKKIWQPMHIN